ncbi:bacterial conjugation TrbI-like family protein (plasmid) [Yersinia pseudotuberculosis IP 32953]|nr:bacterial conjugation TrbI-like family protein [Yersinia pseudotuberculosis IP 32953]
MVGQLGEAGIDGWIDTHFWERFGNTLLLSTVSDVAAVAATGGTDRNRNTDYTENTRAASVEMAKIALENNIGIPPTIYKNQGDIIGMIVGEDIDFSNIYTLRMKQW